MKSILRKAAIPLALSLTMLTCVTYAQNTPPTSSASSTSTSAKKTHGQKRLDEVQQQIDTLHSQLQITDAQSKQWNAYAQVMRDNARKAAEAFQQRAQKMPTMNADEVMKSYARLAQMHADDMQQLSSAWSDLYAALSPGQRKTADELFRNRSMKPHHAPRASKTKPASAAS